VRELAGAALQAKRGEGKERREFGQTLCCEEEDCECHGLIGGRGRGVTLVETIGGELISFWDGIRKLLEASFSSMA
jgi:hypothetical protein